MFVKVWVAHLTWPYWTNQVELILISGEDGEVEDMNTRMYRLGAVE